MMTIDEAFLPQLRYTDVDDRQESISCSSWEAIICDLRMFHLCRLELTVRTLAELPCEGKALQFLVQVRRFFCGNQACARKIFAERLLELTQVYARRTTRCFEALSELGFALGGKAGARLGARLGFQSSRMTLLRIVRRSPGSPEPTPRFLGIDEFAFRRGHTYGTLLVDLFLPVFVKRQFFLLNLAFEARYHLSVLNSHRIV